MSPERLRQPKKEYEMKSALAALVGLSLAFSLPAAEESPFKNSTDKASYALGLNIGKQLVSSDLLRSFKL